MQNIPVNVTPDAITDCELTEIVASHDDQNIIDAAAIRMGSTRYDPDLTGAGASDAGTAGRAAGYLTRRAGTAAGSHSQH